MHKPFEFRRFLFGFWLTVFLASPFFALAQGSYIPYDRDYYHKIERYEILQGKNNSFFQTGFKPYRRDILAQYLDSLSQDPVIRSSSDRFNLDYLSQDNWEFVQRETPESEKPFLKKLYRRPGDFAHYYSEDFDIHLSPVIYLGGGMETDNDRNPAQLTRGAVIRGSIDQKVSFFTYITTTELFFPSWVKSYAEHNGAVPGEGFWKEYNRDGYNFFSARGHVNFHLTKSIQAQIGHDRNFVGEGYRSFVLSDFSNPYMFVKLNTKVWKFQLTNLWTQLTADVIYDRGRPTDGRYNQKWFSMHRLSFNVGKKLNLGFFESVMTDQANFNYFNPIVFFRWVEQQLGTPDKVMLGTDAKWNFKPGMQLYGQFALDEFVFNEFFGIDGKGSKRNKYGVQLGYKYLNVLDISNLDLQLEFNTARPYTFQEKFDYQSYTNWRTPLTHPRGANFREVLGIVRYQPLPRLNLSLVGMYQVYGSDPDAETNWGGDILKNRLYGNPTGLFGNETGQGIENTIIQSNLTASYMLRHNFFIDASHTYRRRSAQDLNSPESSQFLQLGIRWNFILPDFNF
ncbi:hypothetical protein [Algoriphagus sp. CAU 1675]|uniref:hypothetical protein n=1 Tax=Algoriphagus sp. CAU 1675 TaxID=3032597 RepID=UPI0023DA1648|nr:hypothetical protein [Algoriphagus sp. CAU 1675]MDF2157586.1 hypothetical protein [Algoriphagus sp. CAU 1675]